MDHITQTCIAALNPRRTTWYLYGVDSVLKITHITDVSPTSEFLSAYHSNTWTTNATSPPFKGKIADCQCKYLLRHLAKQFCQHSGVMNGLAFMEMNKSRYTKLKRAQSSMMEGEIIDAFYRKSIKPQWWTLLSLFVRASDTEILKTKMVYYITQLMKDAVAPQPSLPHQLRTATVLGLVKHMRATEEWNFPILADALQDAGAGDEWEPLLTHYRDPNAQFSFASWIFRASGNLEYVKPPSAKRPLEEKANDTSADSSTS